MNISASHLKPILSEFFGISDLKSEELFTDKAGDYHGNIYTSLFVKYGSSQKIIGIAKQSPASKLEALSSDIIRKILENINTDFIIPKHLFVENDNFLLRKYYSGFTISQLDAYDSSIQEIQYLFNNVQELSSYCSDDVEALFSTVGHTEVQFKLRSVRIFEAYPYYHDLRSSLAEHYKIPIPGEGFRHIIDALWLIYKSPVRKFVRFCLDANEYSETLLELLIPKTIESKANYIFTLSSILGSISGLFSSLQVYDMHSGNYLISPDKCGIKIIIIDFECFNGGDSQYMTPYMIAPIIDSLDQLSLDYGVNKDNLKSCYENSRRATIQNLETYNFTSYIDSNVLSKRVVLVGTRSYELLIQLIKEAVFFTVVFSKVDFKFIDLTKQDDIVEFEEPWNYFQYWKRVYRLLIEPNTSKSDLDLEIIALISYLREAKQDTAESQLVGCAKNIINSLRSLDLKKDSSRIILERIADLVSAIPFELYFPVCSSIDQQSVLDTINKNNSSLEADKIIKDTFLDLLWFRVPIHFTSIDCDYEVKESTFNSSVEKLNGMEKILDKFQSSSISDLIIHLWNK